MFATVLMSAGLVFALIGAIGAWRGSVTLSWPTTQATLITNAIETTEETHTIPMTDRLRGGIKETVKTETLSLAYRYELMGSRSKATSWSRGISACRVKRKRVR